MNLKTEANQIVNGTMMKEDIESFTYLLNSIIEIADEPGINKQDIRELLSKLLESFNEYY